MALPSVLTDILRNILLTKYLSGVGFTILTYDTFLTLSDEICLVWPERWNLVKALFYTNRIISFLFIAINAYHLSGFIPSFSDTFCQILILTTGYGAIFTFAMTNWLLLTRAVALWGGTRGVVWSMTIFYLFTYIATITIATISSRTLVGHIFFLHTTNTCGASFRPTTFGAIWVPSILFDIVLFGMLFVKIWQHAHQLTRGASSRLLKVLHRDGFIYFMVILGLRIFNMIAWAMLDLSLIFVGVFILWALTTVLITRMHLNLKALARASLDCDEGYEEDVLDTSISFKHTTMTSSQNRVTHTPLPLRRLPSSSKPSRGRRKAKNHRHDLYDEEISNPVSTNIFPGGTTIDPNEDMRDYMAVTRPNTGNGNGNETANKKAHNRYGSDSGNGYDDSYEGSLSHTSHTSHTITKEDPQPFIVTVTIDRSFVSERRTNMHMV